eukprot:759285_1
MNLNAVNGVLKHVKDRFYQTASDQQIVKIEAVENEYLWDKFRNEKRVLMKAIGKQKLNEKYLFHGTKQNRVMALVQKQGFRKEFSKVGKHGYGTYFARDAKYSVNYSTNPNKSGIRKMFCCAVLCGESYKGSGQYKLTSWPKKPYCFKSTDPF